MKKIVMGLETEYGLVPADELIVNTLIESCADGICFGYTRFLENGACIGRSSDHYEYSTPECVSANDVVLYSKAGDLQLQNLISSYSNEHTNRKKLVVVKNNIDIKGNTFGSHENYLLRRNVFEQFSSSPDEDYMSFLSNKIGSLIPFLISRQIFVGAGFVSRENSFLLSQRSNVINLTYSGYTTHFAAPEQHRAIINTRNEPLADKNKYARLHLILGDSNICEFAERLKFGTTSLLIKLCEEKLLQNNPLVLGLGNDPVKILHGINQDINYKIQAGKKEFTALDIQREYFELATKYYSYWSNEDKIILEDWGNTLDWLSNVNGNIDELLGRIDWVTKLFLLTKGSLDINSIDFEDEKTRKRAKGLDISYHCLNENGVHSIIKKQEWFKKHKILTDEQITKALTEPPKTRAFIRGKFVKYLKKLHENGRGSSYIEWDHINLLEGKIEFQEPFYTKGARKSLDDFIDKFNQG